MRYILLALTLITITFPSCSKNDDTNPPPPDTSLYEGTWSGTFYGDAQGTWTMNVTDHGKVTEHFVGPGTTGTEVGTVTENGVVSLTTSNDGTLTGTLNAETDMASGTWSDPNHPDGPHNGSWDGTKD